ncbi:hypothetical protein B4U80_13816 [Leptotrombidium deliense]|uniref:C2H2-type domain-containing protein n=1 Tax=Leptotrombidium deliense TaxID=299467 RepID=A0A443SCP6_9ACAR|nr:hypothetical protein B4U80_13816 [Leptotrombidium deliense]
MMLNSSLLYLFPNSTEVENESTGPMNLQNPFGGWGDPRDHLLCFSYTQNNRYFTRNSATLCCVRTVLKKVWLKLLRTTSERKSKRSETADSKEDRSVYICQHFSDSMSELQSKDEEEDLDSISNQTKEDKKKAKLIDYKKLFTESVNDSYICNLCSKQLKNKDSARNHFIKLQYAHTLRRHIEFQHTNSRKYTCEHCPKEFKFKYNLERHQKIHNK